MTVPRLLAGATAGRPLSLAEHVAVHGPAGPGGPGLLEAVQRSGLRGRGGAGFPTAVKVAAVAARRGPATLLINAAEGDPLSAKDRTLLALTPHLVLDGACAAAEAVGARNIVVAVPRTATAALAGLDAALAERERRPTIRVSTVPGAYLAGEESALVRFLDGGPLKPRVTPPRPDQRGLRRRPTLVQNPETLAHLALIDRYGDAWFREAGTPEHPGTALVTVTGGAGTPVVQEIACGTRLDTVLEGAHVDPRRLQAVLVGGYHGAWIPADGVGRVTLDDGGLARHGGALGAGVVVALDDTRCPVRELAGAIDWLAGESAGQCGPCAHGLPAIAGLVKEIAAGRPPRNALRTLERWGGDLPGRGACHLPDGAARLLVSGLRAFSAELAHHARHGPCPACDQAPLLAQSRAIRSLAA